VNAFPQGRDLVIGVGNPDRGDDAVGLLAARQVKHAAPPGVTVIEAGSDGATLMELWKGAATVIVIDAAHCLGKPGTIHRFDASAAPIPMQSFPRSTHAFGLADGIELSRVLRQLPNRLIVYGIVAKCFNLGASADPVVEAAAHQVACRVLEDLRE
jgi:hydrogenase maturation protease